MEHTETNVDRNKEGQKPTWLKFASFWNQIRTVIKMCKHVNGKLIYKIKITNKTQNE
jgi:hypothetical protein